MATEKQIEACLDDVSEDELRDFILDTNEHSSLIHALVCDAMSGYSASELMVNDCIRVIRDKQWELAEKLANRPRLHQKEQCHAWWREEIERRAT